MQTTAAFVETLHGYESCYWAFEPPELDHLYYESEILFTFTRQFGVEVYMFYGQERDTLTESVVELGEPLVPGIPFIVNKTAPMVIFV